MSSRVSTIALEDLQHVFRDRLVWGAFALVTLLMVPTFWGLLGSSVYSVETRIANLPLDFRMYLVILVAVISYNAIVSERETGTIRLVLGLPGTRRDLILGKLLGRLTAVLLALVPILIMLEIILLLRTGEHYLGTYTPIALWMIFYALVWTCFTIGLSATFSTQYRVLAALAVTYLSLSTLVDIWGTLVQPVFALLFTGSASTDAYATLGTGSGPLWVRYTGRVNPIQTFQSGGRWVASLVDPSMQITNTLPNVFGICILVIFGASPMLLGYYRFQRTDLG